MDNDAYNYFCEKYKEDPVKALKELAPKFTKEWFKACTTEHLNSIDRKTFLKAVRNKEPIYMFDEKTYTVRDNADLACFWLYSQVLPELILLLDMDISEIEKQELHAFIFNIIETKGIEITRRKRRNKSKLKDISLDGDKLPMFSNKMTTAILSANKKKYMENDDISQYIYRYDESMDIIAQKINERIELLDPSAGMILFMLLIKLTDKIREKDTGVLSLDDLTVCLPLKEYMNIRQVKNEGSARETLKRASYQFICAAVRDTSDINVEQGLYNIVESTSNYKDGKLKVTFTRTAAEHIKNSCIINVPKEFFSIDLQKEPTAYYLALKMIWHHGYNSMKKSHDQRHANPNRLSVETLLDSCNLPKYEDIKNTGHISSRIISPFVSALESIEANENNPNGFVRYKFTHEKGKALTEEEESRLREGKISYSDFSGLYIYFDFSNNSKIVEERPREELLTEPKTAAG